MKFSYVHGCKDCEFLGSNYVNGQYVEWWECHGRAASVGGTIMGRYGDEPGEYWSMPLETLREICGESETTWTLAAKGVIW